MECVHAHFNCMPSSSYRDEETQSAGSKAVNCFQTLVDALQAKRRNNK